MTPASAPALDPVQRRRSLKTRGNSRGVLRTIARDVGGMQILVGLGMLPPLALSLFLGEYHSALGLFAAALVAACCGGYAMTRCRNAAEPNRRDAMLIAGAGWLVSAAFGSLPYLLTALWTPFSVADAFVPAGETYTSSLYYFRNPLHALFESMSGYTTTGLTMAVHEPSIGRGLLLYRSITQWIGGAGVVVLSLAILPRPRSVGGLELYQSESTGIKLRPNVIGTARAIWKVYIALTILVAGYLLLATTLILPHQDIGTSLFDSVNHALTAQSTGGFSTLDDSIAGFDSPAMELVHLLPMLLGAVSIPLYYGFLHARSFRVFLDDPQCRSMLVVVVGSLCAVLVFLYGQLPAGLAFREGLFQVVSAVSTTGWQTSDFSSWTEAAIVLIAGGPMLIGGAAGATVGGIKLIRAYLITRAVGVHIRRVLLPTGAVVPFRSRRSGGAAAPSEVREDVNAAAIYFVLYSTILFVSTVTTAHFVRDEYGATEALFEASSALGTVGLSIGITGPEMPMAVELLFIVQMWLGRLEILPVIILATYAATLLRRH